MPHHRWIQWLAFLRSTGNIITVPQDRSRLTPTELRETFEYETDDTGFGVNSLVVTEDPHDEHHGPFHLDDCTVEYGIRNFRFTTRRQLVRHLRRIARSHLVEDAAMRGGAAAAVRSGDHTHIEYLTAPEPRPDCPWTLHAMHVAREHRAWHRFRMVREADLPQATAILQEVDRDTLAERWARHVEEARAEQSAVGLRQSLFGAPSEAPPPRTRL